MKKRKCRMTADEKAIHDTAVKIRKMSDKQICDYIEECKNDRNHPTDNRIAEFLAGLCDAKLPGVGRVTIEKLYSFAKKSGYLVEGKNAEI